MSSRSGLTMVKNQLAGIDWPLLIFLLLFVNVKLVVKAAALVLIYMIRPDFKFGLSLKNSRLPVFYIAAMVVACINYLLYGGFSSINYTAAVFTGIFFWGLCLLAMHQVKRSVERNSTTAIHQTIFAFLLVNAAASLVVYTGIIIETGAINPYRYQGDYQKYFIGTGDYIKGISFDTSTTNAVLNAFAVLYFLLRQKYGWCLFYMSILLLTGSNITNLLLCLVLLFVFITRSTKQQKSIIIACLLLVVVFLAKISPQNNNYIASAWKKFFKQEQAVKKTAAGQQAAGVLSAEEAMRQTAMQYLDSMAAAKKEKTRAAATAVLLKEKPELPQADIHSASFQHKDDTTRLQKELITLIKKDSSRAAPQPTTALPGKAIALLQVFSFLKQHPEKLLTGNGMGNFSSKLAFRTVALKIAGGYPQRLKYMHTDFEKNHLAVYITYFTQTAGQHSLINKPDSVYAQLLGEYGLAGIAALLLGYGWFFWQHKKRLTWGLPLLLFTAGLLFLEYWFEQLSVMVIFELLLFLNIKETAAPTS